MAGKILLVEDEEIWRISTAATLESAGYTVVAAGTAQEARERFPDSQPDAAVLDINLPDGDGVDLLREFMAAKPSLIGVMLTGYATMEKAMSARSLGSVDVLEKIGGDSGDSDLAADLIEVLNKHLGE
ncbi:MAG: response regulator [Planctomycetes bacterium]|nr:response regulator [Planctomycetota bacterium]